MPRQEGPPLNLIEQYRQMSNKLNTKDGWDLPRGLFPTSDGLIHDFDTSDYVSFLNAVGSRSGLVEGLQSLSPLADDALITAQRMTEEEFGRFREVLARERSVSEAQEESGSEMPEEWFPILMPERFLQAYSASLEFEVPLGTALVRIFELQALEILPLEQ